MPLPEEKLEESIPEEVKTESKKSTLNMKVLMFGLPVFILQIIVIYFITANILINKYEHQNNPNSSSDFKTEDQTVNRADTTKKVSKIELGKFIYSIDDLIVNPANTDGKRLLLTNVGFDVSQTEMMEKLKNREAMIKDVVISTLASRDISMLNNTTYRDTLKMEISGRLEKLIPDIKINQIYFSKYIIQ